MSLPEESLLSRFRAGDPDAVRVVSRVARSVVFGKGYYVSEDDRDDIVQETVLDVYRVISHSEIDPESNLEALTRVVAHRRCVDWLRRQRSYVPLRESSTSASATPESRLLRRELLHRAREAISRLGFSYREILRLRLMEGLSYREIAGRLDSTEASVRVRMYTCLRRTREILEAEGRAASPRSGSQGGIDEA